MILCAYQWSDLRLNTEMFNKADPMFCFNVDKKKYEKKNISLTSHPGKTVLTSSDCRNGSINFLPSSI